MHTDLVLINSSDNLDGITKVHCEARIPLGLLSIAAWVEKCNYSVKIYDTYAHSYPLGHILVALSKDTPRIIGINCYSPNCFTVYRLCRFIKEKFPKIIIVIGGPHASCAPGHIFKHCTDCDYIIIGQGEAAFADLLSHPEQCGTGCVSRDQYYFGRQFAPAGIPMGYDALPMPAYHLIDMELYLKYDSQAYIASSRGCYYNCAFCCSKKIFAFNPKFRSHEQVIEEMDYLNNRYSVSDFYFYDDNIMVWDDLIPFCRKITEKQYFWTAQSTVKDLTPEKVQLISKSGCKRISLGIESGSPRIQKYIGKIMPQDIEERVRFTINCGIQVRGYFIIGFPDETKEDIISTAHLICRLKKSGMSDLCIFPARPYPGTKLYEDCEHIFGTDDLDRFQYLDDYLQESIPFISDKLKTYNTIGTKQICCSYSPNQIRKIIKNLYLIFSFPPDSEQKLIEMLFGGV